MDQREGSERRRLVEIDELLRRELRTSAKNLGSLAAISEGNGKGEGGGGPELFVGVAGASSYAGNKRIEEWKGSYCERRKRSC
jgi:hypothetical protein